jgi:hypothetical protein
MNTLLVNLLCSLAVFYAAYRWLLLPALPRLRPAAVVVPILLLHSLRHLGLMFLTTGVVSPDMPWQFAIPAAAGDFLAAGCAMGAAFLIQRQSRWAVSATWLFSVVGLIDFALAIGLSRFFNAGDFLGGAYWIPSFWVPMLIVGHVVVLQVLRQMQRTGTGFSETVHA